MSLGPRSESWLNLVLTLASGVALTVTFLSLGSFIHALEALTPARECLRRTWVLPVNQAGGQAGLNYERTSLPFVPLFSIL